MTSNLNKLPVCAIIGIGPGNGEALSRRFAAANYAVAMLSRSLELSSSLQHELKNSRAFACDVGSEESVAKAFGEVRESLGEVDVAVINAGSGVWGDIESITPAQFESCWRVNTLGTFLVSKQVIPYMKAQQKGSIVIMGATASRRGNPATAAFAAAKMGQKALAESMAKSLWPQGIHVSLIVLDGVVNLPRTRKSYSDKPDSFFAQPADIAELAHYLAHQPKSAWTFEAEARPFAEKW